MLSFRIFWSQDFPRISQDTSLLNTTPNMFGCIVPLHDDLLWILTYPTKYSNTSLKLKLSSSLQFFLSVQSFSYKPRGLLDLFLLRLFVAARPPLLPFVVFLPENHGFNLSFYSTHEISPLLIILSHCFKTNQLNENTYNIDFVIRTGVASKTISHVGKLSSKPKLSNNCFGISWPMSSIHHWIY